MRKVYARKFTRIIFISPFVSDGTLAEFLEELRGLAGDIPLDEYRSIPPLEYLIGSSSNPLRDALIIIEDSAHGALNSRTVEELFQAYCHHRSITCFLV